MQTRLYADAVEQVYFFIAGVYCWWAWTRRTTAGRKPAYRYCGRGRGQITLGLLATVALTVALV